jgi:hypothetical protein
VDVKYESKVSEYLAVEKRKSVVGTIFMVISRYLNFYHLKSVNVSRKH